MYFVATSRGVTLASPLLLISFCVASFLYLECSETTDNQIAHT